MNRFILFKCIITLTILAGCSDIEHINESWLKEIAELAQPKDLFVTEGVYSDTKNGSVNYIEVEIVNSKLFPKLNVTDNIVRASSCVVLLFNHLNSEQRENWTEYRIKIVLDKKEEVHCFSKSDLIQVESDLDKIKLFNKYFNNMNMIELLNLFTKSFITENKTLAETSFKKLFEENGKIIDYKFWGFRNERDEIGIDQLLLFIEFKFKEKEIYPTFGFKKNNEQDKIHFIRI